MALGRFEIRPALAKLIEQSNRLGGPPVTKSGAGLAEDISRLIAHWLRQNHIVVLFRLVEAAACKTFLGKRVAIDDGIGAFDLVLERAVLLVRVQRPADGFTRLLALVGAEPLRNQLHRHIGKRADSRHHQNDKTPGREAPGLGGVYDQHNV
jgi:hypothetical protein